MKVHLVDGTFELFRAFYGTPARLSADGVEVGAVRGLARSLVALLREPGVTHVAVAFDHVIESFRNDLFAGYKTGEGIDPLLCAQFGPAEDVTRALGIVTWPMVEFEADDALATAAARFAEIAECRSDRHLLSGQGPWRSVYGRTASYASTACGRRRSMRMASSKNSVLGLHRFRIGSHWSATPPTAFPAFRAGAPNPPPRVLAAYKMLEKIPDDPLDVDSESAEVRRSSPRTCASLASRRTSTAGSRRCEPMRL